MLCRVFLTSIFKVLAAPIFIFASVVINKIIQLGWFAGSGHRDKMGVGFLLLLFFGLPIFAQASVVIDEVAWMGTAVSAADEWVELKNTGSEAVDFTGWRLEAMDGQPSILLDGIIDAGGYFLLERSDDTTVPDIAADLVYTGALSNSGELLHLFDSDGNVVDIVDASGGWLFGDNVTKETMQKIDGAWITATGTPKALNAGGGANEEDNGEDGQNNNAGGNSGQTGGAWPAYVPPELRPHIKVFAGKDKKSVAGGEVLFHARAVGWDNEPINYSRARLLWNFGDGSHQDGRNVPHIYDYPGTYTVTLTVSSGGETVSDRAVVDVKENPIRISEIYGGSNGWVELKNPYLEPVSISHWILENGAGARFILPVGTVIAPNAFIVLPTEITKLVFSQGNLLARLYYPNGLLADELKYNEPLYGGSIARGKRDEEEVFPGMPTPGMANEHLISSKYAQDKIRKVAAKQLPAHIRGAIAGKSEQQNAEKNAAVFAKTARDAVGDKAYDKSAATIPLEQKKPKQADKTLAAVFYRSSFFWLIASIIVGILAGISILSLRRRISKI